MARWEPGSKERLEEAALELYGERGYERTTVAEIAARAGVTERTFFRHFADKREVLFSGSAALRDLLVAPVAQAPKSQPPLESVAAGLEAVGRMLEERRDRTGRRQAIIDATPELQERELRKMASLAAALREALQERGLDDAAASLTAEAAIAVFRVSFQRWVADPEHLDLPRLMRESLAELKAVAAG